MAIETICSGCGQRLSVADENAGRRARCPACGQIYTVPTVSGPTAAGTGDRNRGAQSSPVAMNSGAGFSEASPGDQTASYWMRAVDGTEYGPVDRFTLDRWFREGRVGPGYQIRDSEHSNWQPADVFRSVGTAISGNPYADDNPYRSPPTGQATYNYPKADKSGLILAMGVLAFFLCPVFGIVAWVMGSSALKDIQAGLADPRGKGLVQVGYYLGIASVILNVICFGGYFVMIAIALVTGAMQP